MAEKSAATPHLPRPASEGKVAVDSPRPARPSSERVMTPNPPLATMGKVAARKRSAFREHGRHVRRRRDCDQTARRFGDIFSVGPADYDADCGLTHMNSFEYSLSSSDKENAKPGRKRLLDDALFEFFRKEAIKSLKSDFSLFCNDSFMVSKDKLLKDHSIGRYSFISYSLKYFCEVVKSLSAHQKDVIKNFGFGCLLLLERCDIPSSFVRWIACCVDPVSHQIIVDDSKVIPISKDSVHFVIGLPNSGSVPMPDSEGGAKFILSMFGLTQLPHITFFGNKLKSNEVLSEKEIFVCFMVVAFKCFLFPTMDEYPNTDFLGMLEEPECAKGVDLCLLIFEHIISGVYKFSRTCKTNGRKPKQFEFCYYILAVYYLDSLDFGARKLDMSVPRISVWKGNLIKFFSDLDYRKNNLFGKRHLKKILPSCYREFAFQGNSPIQNDASDVSFGSSCFSMDFKNKLLVMYGSALEAKIIDGVTDSVQSASLVNHVTVSKSELYVTNVLDFLMKLKCSEVKVPSSETNVLGVDIRKSETIAASLHDSLYTSSEAILNNTDIASNLNLINPQEFSRPVSMSNVGNKLIAIPESPECFMTKPVEQCAVSTAPALHPMKKARSRLIQSFPDDDSLSLKTFPACLNDSSSLLHHDSRNMKSPISRINFSPNVVEKAVSAFLVRQGSTLNKQRSTSTNCGSKLEPIVVAETSPNPQRSHKSPEVLITGSSDFSLRQVELAKKSDELYNSLCNNVGQLDIHQPLFKCQTVDNNDQYIDLSQHATEDCNPKDDLVILEPKKPLALPLVQNRRFPVTNLDVKHFCAIVELAYTRGVQKSYSVKFSKVHCSYISLGQSLQREGHVDNFLIPVFCRKLFEDNHPSKSGRHHFFSFIGENILDYNNEVQYGLISKAFLGAASASKGKRLDQSDMLFFPICRSRHWFTFSVDFKFKLFIFLDSLYNKEDDFHISIRDVLINNFVKLWKRIFKTEDNMFSKYKIMYPRVPKQGNADDCGVFTMKFMEIFKPEVDTCRLFSKDDIVHIRIQYANQIFFCERNGADKSVVLNFNLKA